MAKIIKVTKEGLKNLEDELNERKTTKRNEIKEAIRTARGFGDLSENSEYDEARDAQAKNELRISELEEMLKNIVVEEDTEANSNRVSIGKRVRVKNHNTGAELEYRIVGPTETDPFLKHISDQSPIGSVLMGKEVEDIVVAHTKNGHIKFEILEIIKD